MTNRIDIKRRIARFQFFHRRSLHGQLTLEHLELARQILRRLDALNHAATTRHGSLQV